MSALNKAKIIAVLEAEGGLITGRLVFRPGCEHMGRCAIGALLAAAGVSDERLAARVFQRPIPEEYQILRDAYGMSEEATIDIMTFNDTTLSTDHPGVTPAERARIRLSRVIDFVRAL